MGTLNPTIPYHTICNTSSFALCSVDDTEHKANEYRGLSTKYGQNMDGEKLLPLDIASQCKLSLIVIDMSALTTVNADQQLKQQWTL